MPTVRTKRWNDPVAKDDGTRILITRYRPRALRKERETWDEWLRQLAPSAGLLADFQGKHGPPLEWDAYRSRYLAEMSAVSGVVRALAERVRAGESLTLLCASACEDPSRCHRTLLRTLIYEALGEPEPPGEPTPRAATDALPPKLRDWLR